MSTLGVGVGVCFFCELSMKKVFCTLSSVLLVASTWAATDGSESLSSSLGTVGVAIGTITASKVRIFGLSDFLLNGTLTGVDSVYGTYPGKLTEFCVANSNGAAVRLAVTSSTGWGNTTTTMKARTPAGVIQEYHLSIGAVGGSWFSGASIGSGTSSVEVPPASVQTDTANCTTKKVRASIVLPGGAQPPTTNQFSDTITIVATPM